jgi:hypothetical protein
MKPPTRARMVRWYDPSQLARTGVDVLLSTILAERSDPRPLESLATGAQPSFDYRCLEGQERREMWIDYVADVGDGWNSTYAIASCLARAELTLGGAATPRGDVLVFGGDEVYPVASRAAYRLKLKAPYESALPTLPDHNPHAFAIPGNHDWYDSLVSFTRLFCARDWLGGWWLPQRRSYFALRLPHNWWLLGTDIQLGSDIDKPQVEYFQGIAKEMKPDDGIIICNAEPHWLYETLYNLDFAQGSDNLHFLEGILAGQIRVFLSGDRHYYRRHADARGRQKIIAGGGGAFLHPTCGEKVDKLADGFNLKKTYPSPGKSLALNLRNLAFPLLNFSFVALMGLVYLAAGWGLRGLVVHDPKPLEMLEQVLESPTSVAIPMAILGGCILFADSYSRVFRIVGGTLHGVAHLVAIPLVVAWSVKLSGSSGDSSVVQLGAMTIFLFVFGGLIGAWITGLYLFVSLAVFQRHQNEAFSALAIQDYKNFLRLHIREDGQIAIYPVKIDRVPRHWTSTQPPEPDPQLVPELIEDPVVVSSPGVGTSPP